MLESPIRRGFDLERAASAIEGFIASKVRSAGASGVVLGVSGGVDSALVLTLSVRALGPSGVLALIMPDSRLTPPEDVSDAKSLCDLFGVRRVEIDIAPIHRACLEHLPSSPLAEGNLRARIRMSLLYYHANAENRIVAGTGDRSEYLLGYFTKYGDGGVDIAPILGLYKTEVRALAAHLGVPERVARKPSSPRLWPGQTAEGELGFSYEEADVVLHRIFDLGEPVDKVRESNPRLVDAVMDWHRRTEHKRAPVESPALPL
ncbi:NAD+ synthase [Conexivisphaera calida]|uniref:NH(3)-dependent NAD(+) synthetase n=1 Tax=Conexivisphaera calida TaxID=1874277 RepID=A0A4P2VDG7_9ARCH|nr:NAD+ synthase [Conexivisphaera calida]BBE42649.1 NAD synthetase [Conexivisphaera calida]